MRYGSRWASFVVFMTSLVGLLVVLAAGVPNDFHSDYETDMQAFIDYLDQEYTFFTLKHIEDDWRQGKIDLMQWAKDCESDEEFLRILYDAFRLLRDGHMGIRETQVPYPEIPPKYYPGISFLPATEDRVVVMYAPEPINETLKSGTIVTQIDGKDARRYLDDRGSDVWDEGGFFSSPQRARLFEYRIALRGEEGENHHITFIGADGLEASLTVESSHRARGWPHTYNLPSDLKRVGRSFYYTELEDNIGYMFLRRVDGSVSEGIDEILKELPDQTGWIVDLRGNGGGGYDSVLIERVKKLARPVVVIIDAGCASAGETLARDFRRYTDAYVIGSQSAGSSSSKRTWTFPSGIASLTIPVRSRWRSDGKPIEYNGIEPDVMVEAVPEEIQAGNNSAILRAREYICSQIDEG